MITFLKLKREYLNELIFYRSYHKNTINWTIHSICIPLECFSYLIILSYFGLELHLSVIISLYYLLISFEKSRVIFIITSISQIVLALLSKHTFNYFSPSNAWWVAFFIQIIAWFVQVVIGHKLIENNSPALTTKLSINSIVLSLLLSWDYLTIT